MPEYGNSILCEQGFKNLKENDEVIGFQLRVRVSYYRSIPFSLLDGYEIIVDGETFVNEDIDFSLDARPTIPSPTWATTPRNAGNTAIRPICASASRAA